MRSKLEEVVRERMGEFVEWQGEERAYTFEEIEEEALEIGRALVREMIGVAVVEEGDTQGRATASEAGAELRRMWATDAV